MFDEMTATIVAESKGPNFFPWWHAVADTKREVRNTNNSLYIALTDAQAAMIIKAPDRVLCPIERILCAVELMQDLHDELRDVYKSGRQILTDYDRGQLDERRDTIAEINHEMSRQVWAAIRTASGEDSAQIGSCLSDPPGVDGFGYILKVPVLAALREAVETNKELSPLTIFRAGSLIARHANGWNEGENRGIQLMRDGLTRYGVGGGKVDPKLKAVQKGASEGSNYRIFLDGERDALSPWNRFLRWTGYEQKPDSIAACIEALKEQNKLVKIAAAPENDLS